MFTVSKETLSSFTTNINAIKEYIYCVATSASFMDNIHYSGHSTQRYICLISLWFAVLLICCNPSITENSLLGRCISVVTSCSKICWANIRCHHFCITLIRYPKKLGTLTFILFFGLLEYMYTFYYIKFLFSLTDVEEHVKVCVEPRIPPKRKYWTVLKNT